MKKISFEDALILYSVQLARFFVRFLPLTIALGIGRVVGRAVYFSSKRREIAYHNLRAAFSAEKAPRELRRIARESMENLGVSAVEMLRFPELDRALLHRHFRVVGEERFMPALKRGQGLIFLTAHFGNWELLNVAGGILGYPMVSLARVQKHPRANAYLNGLRTCKGTKIIYKGIPTRELLKALRGGKIVGILSDQDGGRNGKFVPFFGRLSSTPSGVEAFSHHTGAPVFPVFNVREGASSHRVEVEGPVHPDRILEEFAALLEQKIRQSPSQWLWGHRRWKSTPDRFVLVLTDAKAGHTHQSEAVAEAYKAHRLQRGSEAAHTHLKTVEVRFRSKGRQFCFRAIGIVLGGAWPFRWAALRWALSEDSFLAIQASYADLVISCGSSLQWVNRWIARENGGRSIFIMKPQFRLRKKEAALVPAHDRPKRRDNIFPIQGALTFTPDTQKFSPNGASRIGVLVGGDAGDFHYDETVFRDLVCELVRYSRDFKRMLLVTSSRRTPTWADALLKRELDRELCPMLVLANEHNPPGAVNAILGLSERLVVSGESISMVSEAVAAGKPVIVMVPAKNGALGVKHERFLRALERDEKIYRATPQTLYTILKEVKPETKSTNAVSGNLESIHKLFSYLGV